MPASDIAYTPILPLMREDGLTLQQGGWLAAANYVGYLLGALFTVFSHGDRIQRLRGGLLVSIATTLLMGLTHALPAWLLPAVPDGPLSHAFGLAGVRTGEIALGTLIASGPRAFSYALLGESATDLNGPHAAAAIAVASTLRPEPVASSGRRWLCRP